MNLGVAEELVVVVVVVVVCLSSTRCDGVRPTACRAFCPLVDDGGCCLLLFLLLLEIWFHAQPPLA